MHKFQQSLLKLTRQEGIICKEEKLIFTYRQQRLGNLTVRGSPSLCRQPCMLHIQSPLLSGRQTSSVSRVRAPAIQLWAMSLPAPMWTYNFVIILLSMTQFECRGR